MGRKRKAQVVPQERRDFLKQLAAAGGAVALAGAARQLRGAEPEAQAPPAPQSQGYHETAHIRTYYEKAGL